VKNGLKVKTVEPLLPKSNKTIILARYDPSGFRGWDIVDKVLQRISKERDDIEIHLFEYKDKKPTRYKSHFHKGLTGDAMLGLFKSSDIYLAGSRYEGFAYPVIEAMSQGACICSTDAGGNMEFCINEETALVSPRDDVEGLYRNLMRLLDDKTLKEKLAANGINKSKEFVWKDILDELENYFISLSSVEYDKNLLKPPKFQENITDKKGKALFVYGKDPFFLYRDWINIDETVKYIKRAGVDVNALLFVDKYPKKFIKARFELLLAPEDIFIFKYKIFYIRKLKMRLPLLPEPFFTLVVIADILKASISKSDKYTYLIVSYWDSAIVRVLCRLLNIKFNTLNFHKPELVKYSFDPFTKEKMLKEPEYRKALDAVLTFKMS